MQDPRRIHQTGGRQTGSSCSAACTPAEESSFSAHTGKIIQIKFRNSHGHVVYLLDSSGPRHPRQPSVRLTPLAQYIVLLPVHSDFKRIYFALFGFLLLFRQHQLRPFSLSHLLTSRTTWIFDLCILTFDPTCKAQVVGSNKRKNEPSLDWNTHKAQPEKGPAAAETSTRVLWGRGMQDIWLSVLRNCRMLRVPLCVSVCVCCICRWNECCKTRLPLGETWHKWFAKSLKVLPYCMHINHLQQILHSLKWRREWFGVLRQKF